MVLHPDVEHPAVVPELDTARHTLQQLPLFAKELIAGGVAGGLAKTSVAPLERCKILFQTGRMSGRGVGDTLREIYSTEGFCGFFRGNGASVLRIVPYAAVHFTAYEHFRQLLLEAAGLPPDAPQQRVPPALDLVAGSAAGATAVLLTYPLDLVRTRLAYGADAAPDAGVAVQGGPASPAAARLSTAGPAPAAASGFVASQHPGSAVSGDALRGGPSGQPGPCAAPGRGSVGSIYAGDGSPGSGSGHAAQHRLTIRQVLRTTLQQEGVAGLYRGIGPTLVGILPYAGLKFYVYQSLKQQYRAATGQEDSHRLPVPLMLTFGAASGLVAQTATYPLDVVRRRMQVQSLQSAALRQPQLRNTWHALRSIAQTQGWRGLFSGLSINYMKVVPSTAIGFTLYDSCKQFLGLSGNI